MMLHTGIPQTTGMTLDAVTGLYYARNRNYSPSLGVWISQDPADYINGANTYQMEMSGPVGSVDPLGLDSLPGVQQPVHASGLGDSGVEHHISGGRYYVNYYYTDDLGDVVTNGVNPSHEIFYKIAKAILHGLTKITPMGEFISAIQKVITADANLQFAYRGTSHPWVVKVYFCTGKLQSVTLKTWKKTKWVTEKPHGLIGVGGLVIGVNWKDQDREFLKSLVDIAKKLKSGGE